MTSCSAARASPAMALTRAGSTTAVLRCLWTKVAGADRPVPAVGLVRWVRWVRSWWSPDLPGVGMGGSAVEPVAFELVGIDLDADPRSGTHGEFPAADHQRFGEQVVGHAQEVGHSSPARRAVCQWAAPNATAHLVLICPSIWLPMTTSTPRPSHW